MPRLAVLSAASSPCPDLNLIHYIFGRRLTVCRFRINLPNPLPFPCGRKVEKSNNKTLSPYGLFKRGRLKTRHIFLLSNDFIGKSKLADYPVYVYDNECRAGVAQSVEQRIRNAKVGGSIPFSGTRLDKKRSSENLVFVFSDDLFLLRRLFKTEDSEGFFQNKKNPIYFMRENIWILKKNIYVFLPIFFILKRIKCKTSIVKVTMRN